MNLNSSSERKGLKIFNSPLKSLDKSRDIVILYKSIVKLYNL